VKILHLLIVLVLAFWVMGCLGPSPEIKAKEALNSMEPWRCEQTGNEDWNDWCYYQYANRTGVVGYCNSIKNKTVHDWCIENIKECPSSCDDNNPTTLDYCGASTNHVCVHSKIPECPESCNDGDILTKDFCSQETSYVCVHQRITSLNSTDINADRSWVGSLVLTLRRVYRQGSNWCIDLDARNDGGTETGTPYDEECWVVDSAGYTAYEVATTTIHTNLLPRQKVKLTGCYSVAPDQIPAYFTCGTPYSKYTVSFTLSEK